MINRFTIFSKNCKKSDTRGEKLQRLSKWNTGNCTSSALLNSAYSELII